jgi:hypothetical protein
MTSHQSDRMDTAAAAQYIGLTKSTMNKLRVYGGGPRFIKARRRVLYDRADLNTWLEGMKHTSTSTYT